MRLPPKGPRSLSLSSHDMEDVPVLGIATRCDAVAFLFLEHLDLEPVEERYRLVARDESDARPVDPAVARAIPLAGKTTAARQRLANALHKGTKLLRLAQRH